MPKRILCPKCRNEIILPAGAPKKAMECPLCRVVLPLVTPRRRDSDPLVGQNFAYFRVLKKIGQGAMASVYLVKNLTLGRPSALKVLLQTVVTTRDHAERRFIREARSASQIDHPNVLRVYHVGQHEGRYFIEMQYADGGALRDVLEEKGCLDAATAARHIRDAAAGIGAAHKLGIVHRDVKPHNIMLMGDGTVKVSDFGLAKFEDGSTELTSAGILLGTPLYMSPEQVGGQEATVLSDIYSLGITFYELLTGAPPFEAPTPAAVLYMHVYQPLPPLQQVAPGTPGWVVKIIERMTHKNPEARYPSCDDLVRDIDAGLSADRREPEPPAAQAPTADFKVNADSIFRSIARFSVVASGAGRSVMDGLLARAKELGVPEEQARQIIEHTIVEAGVSPQEAAAPPVPPEVQAEAETAKDRRHERLASLRAWSVWLAVAAVVLLIGAASYGALSEHWRRAREKQKADAAKAAAESLEGRADSIVQSAKEREKRQEWEQAAEKYELAMKMSGDERIGKALAAVRQVIQAQRLEKMANWDDAEAAYRSARDGLTNKSFVEERLAFLKARGEYVAACTEAEVQRGKRNWDGALAALNRAAGLAREWKLPSSPDKEIEEIGRLRGKDAAACEGIDRLLKTSKARGDSCATLAATEYYLASPDPAHQAMREVFEKAQAEALKAIASAKDRLRLDEKAQCRRLKLKSGETLSGILVGEQRGDIELDVCQGESRKHSAYAKKDVEAIEVIAPDALNRETASALFAEALKESKTSGAYHALCLLGRLRAEFSPELVPKSPKEEQEFRAAFSDALRASVRFAEQMCPNCVGMGKNKCPKCNGTGNVAVPCDMCRLPANLPMCETCRGRGIRMTGVCEECKGRGKKTCVRCKGKRCKFCDFKGRWVCTACRGTGKTETDMKCWECQGTGKVKDKPCASCFGRGKPVCMDCKGTGRKVCPKCGGTKVVLVPCTSCDKDFTVKCGICRGTGTFTQPDK